tara:strand:- start:1494 stop:2069 length:576 start_codon:yes stop_codon:yes gene_type:complete
MATVYDIIQGISQAAANAYDGSQYEKYSADGKARLAGLKREQGDPITDSRVMDGFGVKFHGTHLIITYHSEIPIKEFHNSKYDEEIEQTFSDIVKFLKKEYKSVTGNALALKEAGAADIHLQNISKVRSWCQAQKAYAIGNLPDGPPAPVSDDSARDFGPDRLKGAIEDWLAMGKDKYPGAKKPKNVTNSN